MIMKQPLLGKKIVELRNQKGLTQDELVQKCNITVRTIQRIESGETTPRNYTIKVILNALGYNYEKIFENEYVGGKFDKILRFSPNNFKQVFKVSFVAGIIYFLFGFVETAYFVKPLFDSSSETNWSDFLKGHDFETSSSFMTHSLIKITSIILFAFFMRGFVLLGSYYKNFTVELMAFLMIITNIIFELSEIGSVNHEGSLAYFILISKAITFGSIMIFFGMGILRLKLHLGNLSKGTGLLEIITGIFFATVFLFPFGLILLIPLELLEVLLLYKVVSKID